MADNKEWKGIKVSKETYGEIKKMRLSIIKEGFINQNLMQMFYDRYKEELDCFLEDGLSMDNMVLFGIMALKFLRTSGE